MKKINLKGTILSPFCIWNGDEWTILDFFIRNHGKTLDIVDQDRILKAINEGLVEKDRFLSAIKKGDFPFLQSVKEKLTEYPVFQTFGLEDSAFRTLSQGGNSSNQGIIKQHFCDKFSGEPLIPGSTIKGILRTARLFWELKHNNADIRDIEENSKAMKSYDNDIFKWITVPDVKINDAEMIIQQFAAYGKTVNGKSSRGISINVQSVVKGSFEIPIVVQDHEYARTSEFLASFDEILQNYSQILLNREASILENIGIDVDVLDEVNTYLSSGDYPIKIGMYKKSLTYKLEWEKQLRGLNRFKGKEWQSESRHLGVGDKILYFSEDEQPVGWVLLENN